MTQYIDKADVIEKIRKLQDTIMDEDGNLYKEHTRSEYNILSKLEEIINTLEVKMVDLEEEIKKEIERRFNFL